jgi:hypothetical protein
VKPDILDSFSSRGNDPLVHGSGLEAIMIAVRHAHVTICIALIATAIALLTVICLPHPSFADELPKSINGPYCKESLNASQTFYKRGYCGTWHPSDGAYFTSTSYENLRDVKCKFAQIKKIAERTYRIQANCTDRHSLVSEPEEFISLFDLEISRRGLLVTYLSEG